MPYPAADFPVNILLVNGVLRIVPDQARASWSKRNSVVWHCVGCRAEVVFERGSPFVSERFEVPAGGFVGSGPVVNGDVGDHFKYRVSAIELNGGRRYDVDPEVIVENG